MEFWTNQNGQFKRVELVNWVEEQSSHSVNALVKELDENATLWRVALTSIGDEITGVAERDTRQGSGLAASRNEYANEVRKQFLNSIDEHRLPQQTD